MNTWWREKFFSVCWVWGLFWVVFEWFLCSVKPLSNKCPETSQGSGFVSSLTDCWAAAASSLICPKPLKINLTCTDHFGLSTPKQGQQQCRFWVMSTYSKMQNILNLYYKHRKHLSTIRWRQKELLVVERWNWGVEGVPFGIGSLRSLMGALHPRGELFCHCPLL